MGSSGLLKILVAAGTGSRRSMANAIKEGRVLVNGDMVTSFNHVIDINRDRVTCNGARIDLNANPRVYLVLNKPAGVLSTTSDDRGRKIVLDYVPSGYKGIKMYPVGRLDKDSTGLILLTNDGEVAYRLSHPRFEHEKEYLVSLDRCFKNEDFTLLAQGIELEDGITSPARVSRVEEGGKYSYSVIIHEGKNRIVRRMFARLGYVVLKLKRVRMSFIKLGDLKSGETRVLSYEEIHRLRKL